MYVLFEIVKVDVNSPRNWCKRCNWPGPGSTQEWGRGREEVTCSFIPKNGGEVSKFAPRITKIDIFCPKTGNVDLRH